MSADGVCKIVLIPADLDEDIEEQNLRYTADTEVSCVQDHAKAHFKRVKPTKSPEQLKAQKEGFLQQLSEDQRKGVTDALLEQAIGMNMVEHVCLISNATDNNFTGVTMYCDDEAVAVGLPLNRRASEIASCAGKPSEVRGDAFLARVFDNEDSFKRLDFTLDEVSSSAAWVREAYAQNERKRKSESATDTMARIDRQSRASTPIKELTPAEAEKENGNGHFKQGNYEEAHKAYSRAIREDCNLLVAFNNRAMASLKLRDWNGALQDADTVLQVEPTNVKAILRRAAAREGLGMKGDALRDYQEVLLLEPGNKIGAAKIKELQSEDNGKDAQPSPTPV